MGDKGNQKSPNIGNLEYLQSKYWQKMSEIVYVARDRVESSEKTEGLKDESEPSRVVYIGGLRRESGNTPLHEPILDVTNACN